MDKNTGKIKVTNSEGLEIEYDVLFTYDSEENKKSYIIFTDHSLDENGSMRVYANTYDPTGNSLALNAIETEKEWQLINSLLSSVQEKLGETNAQNE